MASDLGRIQSTIGAGELRECFAFGPLGTLPIGDGFCALLVGGGSGHGFKLGPALGEHVAGLVLGESQPDPKFTLKRLENWNAPARTQIEN